MIRADASLTIGTGHVMRSLTLADALRRRAVSVTFVCRQHHGHLSDLIAQRGFDVVRLPEPLAGVRSSMVGGHEGWLGAAWDDDATQTRAAIERLGRRPDWLVVDHYAIDHRWEGALRPSVERIFVIDDLADRPHDCDLLLDQNLFAEMQSRYDDKVPRGCPLMLGPQFALLQPVYGELHRRMPPRAGLIQHLLIFFGGADRENLAGRSLSAVLSLKRTDLEVDVVITANCPHADSIRKQVAEHNHVHLHVGVPTLAPFIAKAELALGAGGATSWERICLGLPTVVVTLAEHQRPIAQDLHRRGLINWLGHEDEIYQQVLSQALAAHFEEGADEACSNRCLAALDGQGTARVCAVLTAGTATNLRARPATPDDEPFLREWRKDVPGPEAGKSFRTRLRDLVSAHLYAVETPDGVHVGQVDFERSRQGWALEYILAPYFRGRGLDDRLMQAAVQALRHDEPGAIQMEPGCQAMSSGPRLRIGVCSDVESWINAYIPEHLVAWLVAGHQVTWAHDADMLPAGDIGFYLSYGRIIPPAARAKYTNNLIVHESDLPKGRGWSPLTWTVLEGGNAVVVTLFEAAANVDSGPIYLQEKIELRGDELIDELRSVQALSTFRLCSAFVSDYPRVLTQLRPQAGEPTYYRRRQPSDQRLDSDQSLRSQFNLLRVSDNTRYPAWFEIDGAKYSLKIEKL